MPVNHKRNRIGSAAAVMLAAIPGLFAALALCPAPALAQEKGEKAVATDKLILRTGRIIDGKVLEETDTQVKFMIITAGISAAQWFDRTDVLAVEKGEAPAGEAPTKPDPKARPSATQGNIEPGARAGAKKIYVINLEGEFGVDFSQTPIRDAIKDAKKHQPDYLVFVLDNEWTSDNKLVELPDDAAAAHELFRAEEMAPIFAKEIPEQWGEGKSPEIVFWIKQAMGGTAILSFACPSIYFAPDARLGGLGNLSLQLGSTGDEVVRQKLYSAYMAHVESWAVKGGYDYRLIRAICRFEYVLSYKMVGGRPEYIERMPENPDEFNLTDDGDDQAGRRDTVEERVRGQGNDVLTLNADLARKLGFSRGTVNSIDDLVYALGISRNHVVVKGRADTLMEGWGRGVADAKRDLRRLWREFNETQVQGDYPERSRARGARRGKIREMKTIIARYGESIDGQFYGEYGIPDEATLDLIDDQIRLEQLADKR